MEYATQAYKWTERGEADRAAILAAAYAEAGDFAAALKWQNEAASMAPKHDRKRFLPALDLYESRTPYRDEDTDSASRPEFHFEYRH